MNIAYIRVSTIEQNEQRQIEAIKKHNIEKWFIEKVSAKNMNRPQLQLMLEFAREGDIIYIHDFSRLARSTKDLLEIIEQLQKNKVNLVSNKENLDLSTSTGKLMLTMISAINQFERENMLERQREGIQLAKKNGKYKLKTHKATAKRFRITGSGKIMRTKGHQGHLRRRRSKRAKRQYQRMHVIKNPRLKWRIKKLAPYLER